MPPAPEFDHTGVALLRGTRLGRLAYSIGQGQQVVVARSVCIGVGRQPQDFPTQRCAQVLRVLIAQVVAVGFGKRSKRAENGRLIGVHVGERGRRLACTGGTRASAGGTHRATLPPPGLAGGQLQPATTRVVQAETPTFRHAETPILTRRQPRQSAEKLASRGIEGTRGRFVRLFGMQSDSAAGPQTHSPPQAHSAVQVRSERRRDRRGRGLRGPMALPAPLDSAGARLQMVRSQRFDELALGIIDRLQRRWPAELTHVQFGVEETPPITHDWMHDPIPLAALVQPLDRNPARIVLYRRPIELRARGRSELTALLYEVVIERVADLLGKDPEEVDPRP